MNYKIAPTDLTFLLSECPRCFYNKIRGKFTRPYRPFPSVFNSIDRCMREAFNGKDIANIVPELESGIIVTKNQKVESRPISILGTESTVHFSGRLDAIAHHPHVNAAPEAHRRIIRSSLIDFKTSDQKDASVALYSRQLHSCICCLEQPKTDGPYMLDMQVINSGLLAVSPAQLNWSEPDPQSANFQMALKWIPIEIDRNWFVNEFLREVVEILEGPEPAMPEDCMYCIYQKYKEGQREPATTVI